MPVGDGEAEPLDLQRVHPGDELPAGTLVQPGRAVGGVRGDVAVDEHEVVAGHRLTKVVGGRTAVQREEHRHRVHGVGDVAQPSVQGVAGQLGVHVGVVAGESDGRGADAERGERVEQPAGERVLPGPVEALDDDQSSHGRR